MKLIREVHNQLFSKHLEIHRIIDLLRQNYYWPYMRQVVEQYIRNCYSCLAMQSHSKRANKGASKEFEAFERYVLDLLLNLES